MTVPRPLKRGFVHLLVIGLVAFSAAHGISSARSQPPVPSAAADGDQTILTFDLVRPARAADGEEGEMRTTTFELLPEPSVPDRLLARGMSRYLPTPAPTPLPTPVQPPSPAPDAPAPAPQMITPAAPTVVGTGSLTWPVPGGTISQYFHAGHLALDVAAPYGSTVVAADAGVVTWAGWRNNGGGYVVAVDHGNGMVTAYNHLGSIWVSPGQAVARGQGIAGVGCTGICTGPHVHFEVSVGGYVVNPLRYL